jgi:TolB-like protein
MRRIAFIFVVIILFPVLAIRAEKYTLGILGIETEAGATAAISEEDAGLLARAVSRVMLADLSSLQSLTLVERERIDLLLDEQSLALSGLIDGRSAVEIGRLTGARYLLRGELILTGQIATLGFRVLDAESGAIVAASGETAMAVDLFRLAREIQEELVLEWGIPLSPQERGRLAERRELPLNTLLSLGNALEASEAGRMNEARTFLEAAVRLSPDFTLAETLLAEIEARLDRYLTDRDEGLPGEIRHSIDAVASGDRGGVQLLLKQYWAFIQPLSLANGYYGSWAAIPEEQRDWFFENSIRGSWPQLGLQKAPESMAEVEEFLGRKLFTAHRLLEYLLEQNLPREGFAQYLHPVEGMTGYFLTLFAAVSSGPWTFPPMLDSDGRTIIAGDEYPPLLLRYCDMFLANFPYSSFTPMVTPMMQSLLAGR